MERTFTQSGKRCLSMAFAFLAFWILGGGPLSAQVLSNGSLEGTTGSIPPTSWTNCGGSPDTQILNGTGAGIFGINTPASDGNTYVGFVSTSYGYIEALGQPVTLSAGMAYTGALDLYRSTLHNSWNGTGQCQIWGGTSCSNRVELLWSSGTITNLNSWQTYPVTLTPTMTHSYIIFVNAFNTGTGSMDYFCLDNIRLAATVLPVEISAFSASDEPEGVLLTWETSETSTSGEFEVEWSRDAMHFETIGKRAASTDVQQFNLRHAAPQPGLNFYRLKAIDANGGITFSEVRQVDHAVNHTLRLFPNPSNGMLKLSLRLYEATKLQLRVLDPAGRLVYQQAANRPAGSHALDLSLPDALANGIYHLEMHLGETIEFHNFSLQR